QREISELAVKPADLLTSSSGQCGPASPWGARPRCPAPVHKERGTDVYRKEGPESGTMVKTVLRSLRRMNHCGIASNRNPAAVMMRRIAAPTATSVKALSPSADDRIARMNPALTSREHAMH